MALQELGGYHIGKVVAGGTYATLYTVQSDNDLLIKVFPEHFIDEASFKSRFENCLAMIVQLEHPHLLQLYDYGIDGAHAYLVLPRQPHSLEDILQSAAPLSLTRTLDIVRPIADAVDFLHEQGFTHGDIKPSNLLLRNGNTPLLTDTGLHTLIQDTADLLELPEIVGNPAYLSPEQQRSGKSSVANDVYALAAVSYHCLTGQAPARQELQPPTALNNRLPEALDTVFAKALHRHASRRYQNVAQFIRAFESVAFGTSRQEAGTTTEAETSPVTAPAKQRTLSQQLRRIGCGVALLAWGILMLWPCVLITVLIEGEFVVGLSDRPGHELRMFNIESEDTRGFGFSVAEVAEENADRVCVKTYVRYLIWRGENEPVDYCRCYTRQQENWQATRAVNASCEPFTTPENLLIPERSPVELSPP